MTTDDLRTAAEAMLRAVSTYHCGHDPMTDDPDRAAMLGAARTLRAALDAPAADPVAAAVERCARVCDGIAAETRALAAAERGADRPSCDSRVDLYGQGCGAAKCATAIRATATAQAGEREAERADEDAADAEDMIAASCGQQRCRARGVR